MADGRPIHKPPLTGQSWASVLLECPRPCELSARALIGPNPLCPVKISLNESDLFQRKSLCSHDGISCCPVLYMPVWC